MRQRAAQACAGSPGGRGTLRLQGEAGVRYRLQSSPDLVNWSTVRSDVTGAAGMFEFHQTPGPGLGTALLPAGPVNEGRIVATGSRHRPA